MMMLSTSTSLIIATLSSYIVAAKYPTSPSCTITSTYTPSECCPQIPAETAYTLSECGGCALTTQTVPLNCLVACTVSPTIDPALTTTVTECDQTITLNDPVTKM